MADVLVTATDLAELMLSPTPPVILDVRWQLGDDDGRQHYRDGHLPGAIYVDLDTELAAPPAGAAGGRHPLPAVDDLQAAARRWGIDDDVTVVVYDDYGNLAAARAWWLLRWAGITDVRMLDGGTSAPSSSPMRIRSARGSAVPHRWFSASSVVAASDDPPPMPPPIGRILSMAMSAPKCVPLACCSARPDGIPRRASHRAPEATSRARGDG